MTHLMLEEPGDTAIDAQSAPAVQGLAAREGLAGRQAYATRQAYPTRQAYATRQGHGLAEDFGLGLQHATHFAQDPGRSFSRRHRSFSPRV